MKKLVSILARTGVLSIVLAFALFAAPAFAQVPSSNPPYNTDIGLVLTSTQRTANTYNSANQSNLDKNGVICKLVQTASSGSPSTTFSIQEFDAGTATWFNVKTSTAITGLPANALITGGTQLAVMPGIATTGPTNSDSLNWPLTRVWRIAAVVGSGAGAAGPASTFSVGCNYIK